MTGFHNLCPRKSCALHCLQLILIFEGLVLLSQDISRWDVFIGLVSDWRLESAKHTVLEFVPIVFQATEVCSRN